MATESVSAEAFERVTEGICGLLGGEFPDWDVGIAFSAVEELEQLSPGGGMIRVVPIGWDHLDAVKSRVGSGVEFYYLIYVGLTVPDADWASVLPASRIPFRVYDALRFRKLPDWPGALFARTTDKVFFNAKALREQRVFRSLIEVRFVSARQG